MMKRPPISRKHRLALLVGPLILIQILVMFFAALWSYTSLQLALARARDGAFNTPEQAMRALVEKSWVNVEEIEIVYAGPNSKQGKSPHVWFVTAKVWAERRPDWKPMPSEGYGGPGSFFLHTKGGWVHVPEGAFPELVGLGMKLFGMVPES